MQKHVFIIWRDRLRWLDYVMRNGPIKLFIRMFKAGERNELECKKKTTGQIDKINILKLQKQIRLKYKRKTKEPIYNTNNTTIQAHFSD